MQIWSKSLSASEVLEAMKGYETAPAGLEGYFTFEETKTDADGNIYFPNKGQAASKVAGAYMTTGKEVNGKNEDIKQNQLTTALGVPSITGVNNITYESTKWMIDNSQVEATSETTATVKVMKEGTYPVTVVASNSWGSTSKTVTDYLVIKGIADGIDGTTADREAGYMIYPRAFQDKADLLFAEDGLFTIKVFTTDGRQVSSQEFEARSGELKEVSLGQAASGTYVVAVLKDGKAVRSFKIQTK